VLTGSGTQPSRDFVGDHYRENQRLTGV
jgi:hypothetical protein